MQRNYQAIVEYDGTDYSGFQIQVDRLTIQGELERVLEQVTQDFVRVHGAGRTDAGVHARGQVIGFRTGWSHPPVELQNAMNALLPSDIAVRDVSLANDRFHARFSAASRTYVYNVYVTEVRVPLLDRFALHVSQNLDLESMRSASAQLIGEHDFAAFGQPTSGTATVRFVHRADWRQIAFSKSCNVAVELPAQLQFEIEANGFLRGMVRRLVGTLICVGEGRRTVKEFAEILASRDISKPGVLASPCGLCLWRVRYN